MAQVLIRGLRPEVVEKLKARARRNGRSMEAELRVVLQEAADERWTYKDWATAQAALKKVRALFAGRTFSDSTELIREDRER